MFIELGDGWMDGLLAPFDDRLERLQALYLEIFGRTPLGTGRRIDKKAPRRSI